jgi:ubiquinone/menaquinone biosynthesis C-methylase UbiE
MTPSQELYQKLAPFYDWMSRALLAPFGGDAAFRRRVVDTWNIRSGASVLEVGCGTGLMTRHLLARGANVTAIDNSAPMLERARRRAPGATFILDDIFAVTFARRYDFVLLSYVLHELDADSRVRMLTVAKNALAPNGFVGIVDFDANARQPIRTMLDGWLRIAEPSSARAWARRGLKHEVPSAGLCVVRATAVGLGTARVVLLRPA